MTGRPDRPVFIALNRPLIGDLGHNILKKHVLIGSQENLLGALLLRLNRLAVNTTSNDELPKLGLAPNCSLLLGIIGPCGRQHFAQ